MREELPPEIWKKSIPGKDSSKGQGPKGRKRLLCSRNSEKTFIYLRTQSSRPRDSKGDPVPGWPLDPLTTGHQRAAVLFPFWLSEQRSLQGHLKIG